MTNQEGTNSTSISSMDVAQHILHDKLIFVVQADAEIIYDARQIVTMGIRFKS